MVPASTHPPKTVRDLLALGEGVRAELIGGEIRMTPSPQWEHQHALGVLFRRLGAWSDEGSQGQVFVAPLDVYLPSGDVVEPDVLFVARGSNAVLDRWVRGVPDLLVEVLSPSNAEFDRDVKRELYARNGVPEYWIVDPQARTIEVLRLEGAAYRLHVCCVGADVLTSPGLAGFRLCVRDVFPPA
jgi:Uma2 family endonuclease